MMRSLGRTLFAVTLIALGVLGLLRGDFTALWPSVPAHLPGRPLLAYLGGLVALTSGAGLLWPRSAGPAARMLWICLLGWMLVFKLPPILATPTVEVTYESGGEMAVLGAAAWVLYAEQAPAWDRRHLALATGARGLRFARALYALALIAFGLSHFFYVGETAPLVPGWLPWPTAWAYAFGCTYVAAGVALLVGVQARLAAALATLQMGLFTLLVWLPHVLTGPSRSQWSEFTLSWTMTAGAWVIAESWRGTPWRVARDRLPG